MNAKDVVAALEIVGAVYGKLGMEEKQAPDEKAKRSIQKQMAQVLDAYKALRKERDRHEEKAKRGPQPQDILVGVCVCGEEIKIGKRYSVDLKSGTRLKRACAGCTRTNEVLITSQAYAARMTYAIRDCLCGETLYVPESYQYRPSGRKGDGLSGKVSRASVQKCRSCGCDWKLTLEFMRWTKDGEAGWDVNLRSTLRACSSCKRTEEFKTRFAPKAKQKETADVSG